MNRRAQEDIEVSEEEVTPAAAAASNKDPVDCEEKNEEESEWERSDGYSDGDSD